MIEILKKEDCVGCNACAQRCPKSCISMNEDEQGFLYSTVDTNLCVNCHLCEKVCPVINQSVPKKPLKTFSAKNINLAVRRQSSSGGVFYAIAEWVIKEGGIVFGAKFNDDWEVVHDCAETLEDIKAFQGSKYVQSRIGQSFLKTERFLNTGRKVLFTGTPCQIAGLKRFLSKEYDNLVTADVVCHGVPSPLVWREYLQNIISTHDCKYDAKNSNFNSKLNNREKSNISGISFRDKRVSWEKFGFSIRIFVPKNDKDLDFKASHANNNEQELIFETLDKNLFMKGFLNDLFLRPSCYECPAKCGKSHSDLTLADFWGISSYYPQIHDKTGVSLLLVNSYKGNEMLNALPLEIHNVDYSLAFESNPSIEKSVVRPKESDIFWRLWGVDGIDAIKRSLIIKRGPFLKRVFRFAIRKLRGYLRKINTIN